MDIKLTVNSVKKFGACSDAVVWAEKIWDGKEDTLKNVLKRLKKEDHLDWSNWLIVRLMTYDEQIKYAIFAAEQVIGIYEKKYPDDIRPRKAKAIEAVKEYLKSKDKDAADAADAAYTDAAHTAADAIARKKMQSKILNYGIKLLERKEP